MKAQVRVEFIFGVVFFSILIYFLASQITTLSVSVEQDSIRDSLKGKAITTLTLLSEGILADEPYKLNRDKINMLSRDNCGLLDNYDLGQYRLTINDYASQILFCGSKSLGPPVVSITRTVFVDGNYGNITLEMY